MSIKHTTWTANSLGAFARLMRENVFSDGKKPLDCWFRGHRESSMWLLQPKAFRKKLPDDALSRYERDVTNRFRVLAPSRHAFVFDFKNYGRTLSLMQHYAFPTRLLDWSTSPIVALYFAVGEHNYDKSLPEVDACVWVLDPIGLNQSQFGESVTPSIEGGSVRRYLRGAFHDYYPTPDETEKVKRYIKPGDVFYKPAMGIEFDARIFAQQGAFTVHTRPNPLDQNEQLSGFMQKIIIPSSSVREVAAELEVLGFRKSTLYPDLANLQKDFEARHN